MRLFWIKCQGDAWCPFMTVNLDYAHFQGLEGVFVIWHGGPAPKTVYVGKGFIAERVRELRSQSMITQYLASGLPLLVIWAKVSPTDQAGVESYLVSALKPLENRVHPSTTPVPVNLPWEKAQ